MASERWPSIAEIAERLGGRRNRRERGKSTTRIPCSAHGGDGHNLQLWEGDDEYGTPIVKCWSQQCDRKDILDALRRDLNMPAFEPKGKGDPKWQGGTHKLVQKLRKQLKEVSAENEKIREQMQAVIDGQFDPADIPEGFRTVGECRECLSWKKKAETTEKDLLTARAQLHEAQERVEELEVDLMVNADHLNLAETEAEVARGLICERNCSCEGN